MKFMQPGMSVHQGFDHIATDAESLKDPRHTLRQLSDVMRKCVACHASYQIRTVKQPLKSNPRPSHHECYARYGVRKGFTQSGTPP